VCLDSLNSEEERTEFGEAYLQLQFLAGIWVAEQATRDRDKLSYHQSTLQQLEIEAHNL
jgi:hypothetical protein